MQSICLSIFTFSIGGTIALAIYQDWIGAITQFVVLAGCSILGVTLILLLATTKGAMNEVILRAIY